MSDYLDWRNRRSCSYNRLSKAFEIRFDYYFRDKLGSYQLSCYSTPELLPMITEHLYHRWSGPMARLGKLG